MGRFYQTTSVPTVDYNYKYPFEEFMTAVKYKQERQDAAVSGLYTAKNELLNIDYVPGTADEEYLKKKQAEYDGFLEKASQSDLSGGTGWLNREVDKFVGDPRLADIAHNAKTVQTLMSQQQQLKASGNWDDRMQPNLVDEVNNANGKRLPSDLTWLPTTQALPVIGASYFQHLDPSVRSNLDALLAYAEQYAGPMSEHDPHFRAQMQRSGLDAVTLAKQIAMQYFMAPEVKASDARGVTGGDPNAPSSGSAFITYYVDPISDGNTATVTNEDLKKLINTQSVDIEVGSPAKPQKFSVQSLTLPDAVSYIDTGVIQDNLTPAETQELIDAREMTDYYQSPEYLDFAKAHKSGARTADYYKKRDAAEKAGEEMEAHIGYNPYDDNPNSKHPLYLKYEEKAGKTDFASFYMQAEKALKGADILFAPKSTGNTRLINGMPYISGHMYITEDEGERIFGKMDNVFGWGDKGLFTGNDWPDKLEAMGVEKKGEYWLLPAQIPLGSDYSSMAAMFDNATLGTQGEREKAAYGRNESIALRLTNAAYSQTYAKVKAHKEQGLEREYRLLSVNSAENRTIEKVTANVDSRIAAVEKSMKMVGFSPDKVASVVTAMRDLKNGVLSGDPEDIEEFARLKMTILPIAAAVDGLSRDPNVSQVKLNAEKAKYRDMLEAGLGDEGVNGFSRPGQQTSQVPNHFGLSNDLTKMTDPIRYKTGVTQWALGKGLKKVANTSYSNLSWDENIQSIQDIKGNKVSAGFLSQAGVALLDGLNKFGASKGIKISVNGMARPEITQQLLGQQGAQTANYSAHSDGNAIDVDLPASMESAVKAHYQSLGVTAKVHYHDGHMHIATG